MKTILLALCLAAVSAHAQIPCTIARTPTNIMITWHTQVFAATLEKSNTLNQWEAHSFQSDSCPGERTWVLPAEAHAEFFRLKLNDNGLAPTPKMPEAYTVGTNIQLVVQGVLHCNSNPVTNYFYLRDGQQIGSTPNGLFTDTNALKGMHLYQVKTATGRGMSLASEYATVNF